MPLNYNQSKNKPQHEDAVSRDVFMNLRTSSNKRSNDYLKVSVNIKVDLCVSDDSVNPILLDLTQKNLNLIWIWVLKKIRS